MVIKFDKKIINLERWTPPTKREAFVKLDLNENSNLFDKLFLNELKKFNNFVVSNYPEYDNLLALLGKYTKQPTKNIILTNGGDQAIDILMRLFFNNKSTVIMPSPVFSIYDHVLKILNVNIKHITYNIESNCFKFPFNEVLKNIDKVDGLILCNPNNPLGCSIEENDLLVLIKKTNELNIPCIIDEAYFEFYGKTSASLIKKYKNIIIVRTFSKMFGLAGLRLGYILADKSVTEQLLKIRGPWDVNHFAVFAGEIVLKNIKYFSNKLKLFLNIKKNLEMFLTEKDFEFYKSNTNFIVVKHKNYKLLLKQLKLGRILVNDISHYPFNFDLLKDSIRITIPSSNAELNHLKLVLAKIINN